MKLRHALLIVITSVILMIPGWILLFRKSFCNPPDYNVTKTEDLCLDEYYKAYNYANCPLSQSFGEHWDCVSFSYRWAKMMSKHKDWCEAINRSGVVVVEGPHPQLVPISKL
jgi:hypothetical protein